MSAKERYIVGVDLGGTNIVAGAMPLDGSREIAMHTTPTLSEGGASSVVDRIAGMIEQVIAQTIAETGAKRSDFVGVGIGSPGPLNRAKGIVIVTPNLGWKNFPLRDEISSRVKLEATLDNDANCATLGEFWCGAAVGGTADSGLGGPSLGTGATSGSGAIATAGTTASGSAGSGVATSPSALGKRCGVTKANRFWSAWWTAIREKSRRRLCTRLPSAATRRREKSYGKLRTSWGPASPICSTFSIRTSWYWRVA